LDEGRGPPDRNDEYMFYQMLVGSWPMELLEAPTADGLEAYQSRIQGALAKSLREGKQRSNWPAANLEYEAAMLAFAREALRPEGGFLTSFLRFVERIARLGVQNSLVQTALKLTAPGVPDIYHGCELWGGQITRTRILVPFAPKPAANAGRGSDPERCPYRACSRSRLTSASRLSRSRNIEATASVRPSRLKRTRQSLPAMLPSTGSSSHCSACPT